MRTFLLLMLLSIITLVLFTAAISGYRASITSAEQVFDDYLRSFAHAMAVIPVNQSTRIPLVDDDLVVQVWQGSVLLGRSSNAPEAVISNAEDGFGSNNFHGQRWRTYAWQHPESKRLIMVAQAVNRRIALAEEVAQVALSPMIVATPILALLIAMTVTRGLSPLRSLSSILKRREADDFTAISLRDSPAELQPVVETINALFGKVELAFEREKRFASDAAHELRTPLSVLQVSIHNLNEQRPELADELNQLRLGVQRMSHVVEQILLLNRTHPDQFQKQFKTLCITELCRQVIATTYEDIVARDQTIELEGSNLSVKGDSFALSSLLANLIGNASKYTPAQGDIRVTTSLNDKCVVITVEDSGPGIPEAEFDRVLDRFYRIGGDQSSNIVSGCGLGMAIVNQVITLHGGAISLSRSSLLGGLAVEVTLPQSQRD